MRRIVVCLLVSAVTAQSEAFEPHAPFPKPGADPTGVVVDRAGRKIVGARVALHLDAARSRPWSQALQQVLRETPLPSCTSDRDGEFVLPLARDQRLLGRGGEGSFWLVVDKAGFQRWVEPLPGGLDGYLGSRVVLDELGEHDRITVVVEEPEPGMSVSVSRLQANWPEGSEKWPVPADGRVSVLVPLLPSPVTVQDRQGGFPGPIGLRAELWRGESSCGRKAVAPGEVLRWPKSEWSAPGEPSRRRAGSRPSTSLARAASADAGWSILLRVRDPDGRPVRGAMVLCDDAAAGPASAASSREAARGPFRGPLPHSDERGDARIRGIPAGVKATTLHVLADGLIFEECSVESRGEEVAVEVSAVPSQRVRVVVVDREQAPMPFLALRLGPEGVAANPYAAQGRSLASDSLGRVVASVATPKAESLVLGCGGDSVRLEASADVQRVELDRRSVVLVRKQREDVITQIEVRHRNGASGTSGRAMTDACGLIVTMVDSDRQAAITLTLATGPRIKVTSDDVKAAPRFRGVAVIDRSRVARCIALKVLGHDGTPVAELARTFDPGLVSTMLGPMSRAPGTEPTVPLARASDGSWSLTSHDLGPIETELLSPEHLPYTLRIPEQSAREPDRPVEVRLVRGATLVLRLVPRDFSMPTSGGSGATWSIELTSLADRNRVERQGFDYGTIGMEQYGQPMTFPCARAFPPGRYRVKVLLAKQIEREVELEVGKPVTLDLTVPDRATDSRPAGVR